MSDNVKVRLFRDPRHDGISIHITMLHGTELLHMDHQGNWWKPQEGVEVDPLCKFQADFDILQKLADALYEFGVTPHGYIPQRGEIEAMERHLEDMRIIAANALKVDLNPTKTELREFKPRLP